MIAIIYYMHPTKNLSTQRFEFTSFPLAMADVSKAKPTEPMFFATSVVLLG